MSINGAPVMAATVVAVDVGKNRAALSVTDADRRRLLGPVDFAMTAPAVAAVLERVCVVLPAAAVKVGIEAAGHYHRPLLAGGGVAGGLAGVGAEPGSGGRAAAGAGPAPGEDRRD